MISSRDWAGERNEQENLFMLYANSGYLSTKNIRKQISLRHIWLVFNCDFVNVAIWAFYDIVVLVKSD